MLGEAATVVITVTVILGSLAIAAVALRLYCRKLQQVPFGADDYCVIVALFLSTGINIVTDVTATKTGVGDPSYVPTLDAVVFAAKARMNFGAENAQIAAMGIVKVSVLLFYKRIFVTRWFQRSSNVLIGIITCFTLAIMLGVIFSKWPVYDQWNPKVPYNINISAILIAYVAGNTLFDLLTLSLPLAALRGLQMDPHRKLILSTIFSLGSICVIASLFRLAYAAEFVKAPQTTSSLFEVPFIYNSLWSNIEPPVFIITSCSLCFGPLYRDKKGPRSLFRSLRSRLMRSSSEKSSANPPRADSDTRDTKHAWVVLQEPHKDNSPTSRAQWEMANMSSTEEIGYLTRGASQIV